VTSKTTVSPAVKVAGIVAAGGQGTRLGAAGGKQLLEVAGRPVAAWAIDALASAESIQSIVVVCDPERVEEYAQILGDYVRTEKPLSFVAGGSTREESVRAGLEALGEEVDIVAVHDGARPLLDGLCAHAAAQELVHDCGLAGVVVGNPAVDTLKSVKDGCVTNTPDRSLYWHAQTPQIFWRKTLMSAYKKAQLEGYQGTDDASYCEYAGGKVRMFAGSRNNIKVTTSEDLEFAEVMLTQTKVGQPHD